jgi:tRNA(Ile)-lysidine synthase
MTKSVVNEFDSIVKEQFVLNLPEFSTKKIDDLKIGVAVSGGADSVSLLISLCHIFNSKKNPLNVITVNHFIRPEEETCGDVFFVKELCNSLKNEGYNLELKIIDLEKGEIENLAKKRKCGIEEAARFVRYSWFEKFICQKNLDCLCLAHNKNDQMETLLMRFLQGSSGEALSGIKQLREKYFRPLLVIEREEIEKYLNEQKIDWRTDKTNFDTNYLRNKIRHKLVPLLDEEFAGWKTALQNGVEKSSFDSEIIEKRRKKVEFIMGKNCVKIPLEEFDSLLFGEKVRELINAANLLGCDKRIPFGFLKDVINSAKKMEVKNSFCKKFLDVEIKIQNKNLFVKKADNSYTDVHFFAIIENEGNYDFPFGELNVVRKDDLGTIFVNGKNVDSDFKFPFCVHNLRLNDEIENSEGNLKKIADIFSDWHVTEEDRILIPIFQELQTEEQRNICIIADFLGYKNWIVSK